jgi:glycerol dehydrogenase-like iron-containing ADH family enzyme
MIFSWKRADVSSAYARLMRPFVYNALPARVIFGSGTSTQVAKEVEGLSCKRALVLTDSSSHSVAAGERIQQHLGDLGVGLYTRATMHTPRHVTDDALKTVDELEVDCVVSVGGGSTIGLGKAIVLNYTGARKIKQVVLPTTCEQRPGADSGVSMLRHPDVPKLTLATPQTLVQRPLRSLVRARQMPRPVKRSRRRKRLSKSCQTS